MSANTEIKILAGHTYRTIGGRRFHVLKVEGWRVTYRISSGEWKGAIETTSVVDLSKVIAEDVTP